MALRPDLGKALQENRNEARRLQKSSEEHRLSIAQNKDEGHRAVREHCQKKLKLCITIRRELETARQVLDEYKSPLTDEDVREHYAALTKIIVEEDLLRRELP